MTTAIRSRIMHFRDDNAGSPAALLEYFDDGVLVAEAGKITTMGHARQLSDQGFDLNRCEHFPNAMLVAGFIDAHVHAPQLDVMASYGEQLLDWLERYTFPAESKFADADYSGSQTTSFLRALLANGTTSAMVFTTSIKHSAEHLFEQAYALNMRMIAGKTMMDRNAPRTLLDSAAQSRRDNESLIRRWHDRGRLAYALTPRFAGTSTREQLKSTGATLKKFAGLRVQTHLSENLAEVTWTQQLFPEAKDYLDIYERYALVGPHTTFAHCLHLSDSEIERLAARGCSIAFCPSSNLFLGSGLFDYGRLSAMHIPIALASDVGAGTGLSAFNTMGEAYKVCQLQGYALSAAEAFYLTSLGAARSLGIEQHVGNLRPGSEADFLLIDAKNHPRIHTRIQSCTSVEEELFVYMIMGDERLIARTYVAGKMQYEINAFVGNATS